MGTPGRGRGPSGEHPGGEIKAQVELERPGTHHRPPIPDGRPARSPPNRRRSSYPKQARAPPRGPSRGWPMSAAAQSPVLRLHARARSPARTVGPSARRSAATTPCRPGSCAPRPWPSWLTGGGPAKGQARPPQGYSGSRHSKAPASSALNSKLGARSLVELEGASSIVVTGATVSIVHVYAASGPTLSARSVARTWKVCSPVRQAGVFARITSRRCRPGAHGGRASAASSSTSWASVSATSPTATSPSAGSAWTLGTPALGRLVPAPRSRGTARGRLHPAAVSRAWSRPTRGAGWWTGARLTGRRSSSPSRGVGRRTPTVNGMPSGSHELSPVAPRPSCRVRRDKSLGGIGRGWPLLPGASGSTLLRAAEGGGPATDRHCGLRGRRPLRQRRRVHRPCEAADRPRAGTAPRGVRARAGRARGEAHRGGAPLVIFTYKKVVARFKTLSGTSGPHSRSHR